MAVVLYIHITSVNPSRHAFQISAIGAYGSIGGGGLPADDLGAAPHAAHVEEAPATDRLDAFPESPPEEEAGSDSSQTRPAAPPR